jgi:hypothetical protein
MTGLLSLEQPDLAGFQVVADGELALQYFAAVAI